MRKPLSIAAVLSLSLWSGCAPSPCQQYVQAWYDCYCPVAKPDTTHPQATIDAICASPETLRDHDDSIMPVEERVALKRCDQNDADWAARRVANSECHGGGYVCTAQRDSDVCAAPPP